MAKFKLNGPSGSTASSPTESRRPKKWVVVVATLIGLLLFAYFFLTSGTSEGVANHSWEILWRLQMANMFLGLFNLLPGYPLDGGHIAQAVLARFMRRNRARVITGYIGVAVGFLLIALGFQGGGFGFTVLVGILLIIAASQEIQSAQNSRF